MRLVVSSLTLAAAAAFLLPATNAGARQIDWSGSLFSTNLKSDGISLLDGTFSFVLGTFGDDFIPSEINAASWFSAWKPLDTAIWTPAVQYFTKSSVLNDNTVFAEGEKAYLWVYNNQVPTTTSEWALISAPSWTIPDAPGDPLAFPLAWTVTTASQVPFGGLKGTEGPGTYSPPAGAFELQTHTFLEPIPEPSLPALAALGFSALALCRRRPPSSEAT